MRVYIIAPMAYGKPIIGGHEAYSMAGHVGQDWGMYLVSGSPEQIDAIGSGNPILLSLTANLDSQISGTIRTKLNDWLIARGWPTVGAATTGRQAVNEVFARANQYFSLERLSVVPRGTTYYIDSIGGNDNNSGLTQDAAWQTLSKATAMWSRFDDGDSILLRRGRVWSNQSLEIHHVKQITIGAYGDGPLPTIDGGKQYAAGMWVDDGNGAWSVEHVPMTGVSGYEGMWDSITGYGYGRTPDYASMRDIKGTFWIGSGIWYVNLRDGDSLGNLVLRNAGAGIHVAGVTDSILIRDIEFRYLLVGVSVNLQSPNTTTDNCFFHHCGIGGVDSYGRATRVTNCIVNDNGLTRGGGVGFNGSDSVAEDNSFARNGGHGLVAPIDFGFGWGCAVQVSYEAQNCVVRRNLMKAIGTGLGLDIGANIENAGANSIVERNVMWGGHTVAVSNSSSPGTQIIHNTAWGYRAFQRLGCIGGGINILRDSPGCVITGNILATNRNLGTSTGNPAVWTQIFTESDRNMYWQDCPPDWILHCTPQVGVERNYTFDEWRLASGQDAHSPYPADPMFVDAENGDFHLLQNSPAGGLGAYA